MTGKERILAVLNGGRPDRVPFAPNLWQWFQVNDYNGTLPPEIRGLRRPVDALRYLGADLLSAFFSPRPQPTYRDCDCTCEFSGGLPRGRPPWSAFGDTFSGGLVRRERIGTPHGALTQTWEYSAEVGAPFETEHWWKDFSSEYPAVRYWLEHSEWHLDADTLRRGLADVGEDGVVSFQLMPSPLKKFHWLAGQVNASYFIIDHPKEMQELADIYQRSWLDFVAEVAGLPEVWIYEVTDNLDTLFYPPDWFRQFCVPAFRRAADILHARGKYLFVHACGKLKQLAPLILEAGVDCVEGQSPPPLGDWPLHEARRLSEQLVVCGGMAAPEQELNGPGAAGRIDGYVADLFASMGDKRRFIFGSSCGTSPRTSYANLVAFRDAAWKYGKI